MHANGRCVARRLILAAMDSVAAEWEVLDDRFSLTGERQMERLFGDCRWVEGPVYVAEGRFLLWSDVPGDRMFRWDEASGLVSIFREPSGNANGNTLDRSGRLVTCEHGGRRVTRTEHDGTVTVVADRWEGKRLNSPNDVVVKSDGSIWFTDPSYGIESDYEGHRAESEIGGCHVYRVEPRNGEVRRVAADFVRPNGLAFSPDERRLYISDTQLNHLRVFSVGPDHRLEGGEVIANCDAGAYDGFRVDEAGRIWAGAADGVHCLAPDGTPLAKLRVPEVVANVEFGGRERDRLFICASTTIYAIRVGVAGASTTRRD